MRPLVATVDLSAIRHNYALAKRCAPQRQAFAVVKANAYGHGAREVVTALHDDADGFAVACLEEAAEVRALHASARILLLEGCFEASEYALAGQLRLDLVIPGAEQGEAFLAAGLDIPLNVWLKLDSGMHRLGFDPAALRAWHARLRNHPGVRELNLISHFACADERNHPLTEQQLESFLGLLDLDFDQRSLANSAAVLTIPAAHMDWLRPGIMLYGSTPLADLSAAELGLRPAMSLGAQLISLREVAVGESVGYGATWIAERPARIGTVSCGYADGYPRTAPAGTPVLVGGRRATLAGRVSMDMLAVDLSDLPEARVGDPVELWGAGLSVDEVARACGTLGYELLSKVTARVPRRYSH
ncbi:alanine racemase [Pseudomonas aeruginosa]|uniref:alanine racemase n=1 Tax=Pseudomonas aeruginosa TaxID=287 RepID=UPI0022A39AFF|nr:alanine racemase [Pseudomonas aeruginosa]ELK4798802.1 alanine racemase [Pseudomonas aeruginosa]ELK4830828.1 alanine racemase [Pseudomonas aeruginosa]MCZ0895050.1 alanine racemase [Pseudomonas aeruginosa]MDU0657541.1 alanine racemase [Pseudomonas aeruginosa]HCU2053293.1 alanine racemase [Pseudomonas aeruginosa]